MKVLISLPKDTKDMSCQPKRWLLQTSEEASSVNLHRAFDWRNQPFMTYDTVTDVI